MQALLLKRFDVAREGQQLRREGQQRSRSICQAAALAVFSKSNQLF
jgi:hypothetical protein